MTGLFTLPAIAQSRFLVIGYGDELRGDDAVGLKVAQTVASWQLPFVKTMAVHQLGPELMNDIAAADYVIFVDACSDTCHARTVQLDPMVVGTSPPPASFSPRSNANSAHSPSCHPLELLNLANQLYGKAPQAWLLKVPTERFNASERLSSITQRGCDQAVRTIEQFWKTYQQPVWMGVPA
jgi:hydrogenase maturation protease